MCMWFQLRVDRPVNLGEGATIGGGTISKDAPAGQAHRGPRQGVFGRLAAA